LGWIVPYYKGKLKKNASEMSVVEKGTKKWSDAVKSTKKAVANGEKFNIRVSSKADAHDFLKEVNGGRRYG
jgi:hypothetical protein